MFVRNNGSLNNGSCSNNDKTSFKKCLFLTNVLVLTMTKQVLTIPLTTFFGIETVVQDRLRIHLG